MTKNINDSMAPKLLEALEDLITVLTTDPGALDRKKRIDSHIRTAQAVINGVRQNSQ